MKIVNICMNAPFTEGYSYQDNLLSEYQQKLGHDVTVISSVRCRGENGSVTADKPGESTLANGVRLIRLGRTGKIREFFGYYPEIYGLLRSIQPDFVFVHGLCSLVPRYAVRYKRRACDRDVHIVADNHQDRGTTKTEEFLHKERIRLFRCLWKRWIKYVEKVYGTTSWRKTFAAEIYGIPEDKLDTLIMGVDSEKLPKDHSATRDKIRRKLGIPERAFMLVTGGKLDSKKCIIEMMEAFSHIDDPDAVFLVFGSVCSDVRERFDELTASDKRIKYIGYLKSDAVKEYFIASDFGVFAGRHSVLWEEAIGCGLPCLFRRYEEVDHVEVCGNCISIREPNADTIKRAMERVMTDREYYAAMKAAAEAAAETFSYWSIAEKSLETAPKELNKNV